MVIARDRFFYPTFTQIKDYFSCSKLNATFSFFFKVICLPTCGCSFFILPTGWYRVCEIQISQMGKNSGNLNLVCKKIISTAPDIHTIRINLHHDPY